MAHDEFMVGFGLAGGLGRIIGVHRDTRTGRVRI